MRKTKKVIRRFLTLLIIVLFVFAMSFMGFGYLVNKYSPEVDVKIGENTIYNPEEKIANIDDRLQDIQNEDNGVKTEEQEEEEEIKPEENREEVVLKQNTQEEKESVKTETPEPQKAENKEPEQVKAPIPQKLEIIKQSINSSKTKTKVFVGYYNTVEQAVLAQNDIKEQMPTTSPFIKEVNGYYIVQVGVFNNEDKAIDLYTRIKDLNYPAKIKSE